MSADTQIVKPANKRGSARLAAVQALYQMDITGARLMEVVAEFENFRLGKIVDPDIGPETYLEADPQWFRAIIAGVVEGQKTIDPIIHKHLPSDWPLSRIETLLRSILRSGVWELAEKKEVPAPVIISEYVDVAKAFFEEEEPKLVNGLLDRVAREIRDDKMKARSEAKSDADETPDTELESSSDGSEA